MDMKPLRCGVVGVGSLGQHHARVYAELPEAELVGVVDHDPKRAAEVAERHGVPVFADAEALGAECDAVSVVVPTNFHEAVALALLRQGCHLLIEKPICDSLESAERVVAAAQAAQAVVQVGHIEHFNPVMGYLEERVDRPRYITADRLAPFTPRGTEVGVVLDLMIHDIGIVLKLVKAPLADVRAVGVNVLSKTEDIANARLEFADGCVANLNTSRVSLKKERKIRLFQNQAYLSLDFIKQEGSLIRKKGMLLDRKSIPLTKDEPLKLELASFLQAVRLRQTPKVDAEMGKTALEVAMQITDQIRASM